MGIPCYDQEIIDKLAEQSGFSKEYIAERGEYAHHANWLANMFASHNSIHAPSNQDYLWGLQKRVLTDIANQGPCVIVGRCADSILQKDFNCLKVFIHASIDHRADRIVKVYGDRKDSPKKRLRHKDKKRKAYYRYYTETEWGVAKNYHIALDSGALGIQKCVDMIVAVYNHE